MLSVAAVCALCAVAAAAPFLHTTLIQKVCDLQGWQALLWLRVTRWAGCSQSSTVHTPLAELVALERLYDSTNGDQWVSNFNWRVRDAQFFYDPCENNFYGIICDDQQRIIGINLSNNG